jgi:branched-chain amino acid transport system substrate-binding protein
MPITMNQVFTQLRTTALAGVLAVGAAGCTSTPQPVDDGNVIVIGAVWSLTGPAALYGTSQRNAADLAVAEINASGRLGGRTIRLITEDDRSTQEGALAAVDKLTSRDRAVAILGPTLSNSAKAANPIAQERKVVVLGVSNTADGIVEIGDHVFRNSLPERVVQPNTIRITQAALKYRRVAVLYGDDDAFTKSGYDVFRRALEEAGIEIVSTQTFQKADNDLLPQLTRIKSTAPDAIVVSALGEEAALIMTQARQLGLTQPIIGGNGFNSPKLMELAGRASEGAISGAAWFIGNSSPANQKFVSAYRDRFKIDPDQFAAQAYAGVYLLAEATVRSAEASSAAIRRTLAEMRDVDTVLGRFSFDEQRNPVHDPVVQTVRDGRFDLFR